MLYKNLSKRQSIFADDNYLGFINLKIKGKLNIMQQRGNKRKQCIVASLLGVVICLVSY